MGDLRQVVADLDNGLGDLRDRTLLRVGTAAVLRRSELITLDVADIAILTEGLRIMIRRSKTDRDGAGAVLAIGRTGRATCPAPAFEKWLFATGIIEGPALPSADRPRRLGRRLAPNAAAGLDPDSYSSHSMRAGIAGRYSTMLIPSPPVTT
ncbi:hypothetical protein D8770_26775 [Methylobacterium sp. DB1607]|nr:hypothetical protein [Methylobacterium sp. DB1607]